MVEQIWQWPKKSLVVKNLQFFFYPHETWSKKLNLEVVTLTKFHEDSTKIVDFLLIVTFLASSPWCVLTRFSPVSCFADLQEQNVFKIDFEHKFEKFRTLAFHWYQFYQDLNNFY